MNLLGKYWLQVTKTMMISSLKHEKIYCLLNKESRVYILKSKMSSGLKFTLHFYNNLILGQD